MSTHSRGGHFNIMSSYISNSFYTNNELVLPRSVVAKFDIKFFIDHTTLNTPVLVRSPKLSSVGPV